MGAAPTPCLNCIRGEFADDDSDGLKYIAKPKATRAHIKRPRGSEGSGADAIRQMVWAGRGPSTYCGQPIDETWQPVAGLN